MLGELNVMNDESRLYYEAHITLEKGAFTLTTEAEHILEKICEENDLRPSTFLLLKPEDPEPHAFVSCRDKSLRSICEKVRKAVRELNREGFKVKRWKVEDTVLDSNRGDELHHLDQARASLVS